MRAPVKGSKVQVHIHQIKEGSLKSQFLYHHASLPFVASDVYEISSMFLLWYYFV